MSTWENYKGLSIPDSPTGDAGDRLRDDLKELADRDGGRVNLTATTDPTAMDDLTAEYYPGSRWLNTTTGKMWTCVDNTTSAAVWMPAFRPDSGALGVDHTVHLHAPGAADKSLVVQAAAAQTANLTEWQNSAGTKVAAIGPDGELNFGAATQLTIASGAITASKSFHKVETESAASSDNLDTISGGADGDILAIRPAVVGHTVVAKNGTGNLKLNGDYSMSAVTSTLTLIFDGTNWLEVARSITNGGGGGSIDVYENGSSVVASATRLDFKDLKVENPSGSIAAMYLDLPSICNGRLTLTSGVPVTTSDVTGATTLYFAPHNGSKVSLYDGTRWKLRAFTERSLSIPSAVFRTYDIYLYDNSGTLTLEAAAWDSGGQVSAAITGGTNATPVVVTSNAHGLSVGDMVGINGMAGLTAPNGKIWYVSAVTTNTFTLEGSVGNAAYTSGGTWYKVPTMRTTGITLQDGVFVKSGDSTRRYIGTMMTTSASGQCEDSKATRYIWNMNNRVARHLVAFDTTSGWTYTTPAYRAANANTTAGIGKVQCVVGIVEDTIDAFHFAGSQNSAAAHVSPGIGLNRTTVNVASIRGTFAHTTPLNPQARYNGYPLQGYNYIQRLEYSEASYTTVWWGNGGGLGNAQCGMQVEIRA